MKLFIFEAIGQYNNDTLIVVAESLSHARLDVNMARARAEEARAAYREALDVVHAKWKEKAKALQEALKGQAPPPPAALEGWEGEVRPEDYVDEHGNFATAVPYSEQPAFRRDLEEVAKAHPVSVIAEVPSPGIIDWEEPAYEFDVSMTTPAGFNVQPLPMYMYYPGNTDHED